MVRPQKPIEYITTSFRQQPPSKFLDQEDGCNTYLWYITEDEYLRLNKLFRRDFQEVGLGGTKVIGLPTPCPGCGKYMEFIDWVWTAVMRGVHSPEFIFQALAKGRQGDESDHDVYCSECGMLRTRRKDMGEGGAANITLARNIELRYTPNFPEPKGPGAKKGAGGEPITWGKWWLDNRGKCLVAKFGDKVSESSRSSTPSDGS